jgi:rhodanese-related sulfurtransferase
MTESESLHPRRRLAAFAFTLLVALSIASTLAWNTSFRGDRPSVREASVQEANAMIAAGAIAIDVRERSLAASAHLPGAMLIPLEVLQANLPRLEAYKAHPVVVYCGDGTSRGPEAAALLERQGFSKVVNLQHGLDGWRSAGLPVAQGD